MGEDSIAQSKAQIQVQAEHNGKIKQVYGFGLTALAAGVGSYFGVRTGYVQAFGGTVVQFWNAARGLFTSSALVVVQSVASGVWPFIKSVCGGGLKILSYIPLFQLGAGFLFRFTGKSGANVKNSIPMAELPNNINASTNADIHL
jgi:hypothetical protein